MCTNRKILDFYVYFPMALGNVKISPVGYVLKQTAVLLDHLLVLAHSRACFVWAKSQEVLRNVPTFLIVQEQIGFSSCHLKRQTFLSSVGVLKMKPRSSSTTSALGVTFGLCFYSALANLLASEHLFLPPLKGQLV